MITEEVVALQVLSIPEDDPDPPVFWRNKRMPFVGACARKAARDTQYSAKQRDNVENVVSGFGHERPEDDFRFSRKSDGLMVFHDEQGWPSYYGWHCCGCGKRVIDHG